MWIYLIGNSKQKWVSYFSWRNRFILQCLPQTKPLASCRQGSEVVELIPFMVNRTGVCIKWTWGSSSWLFLRRRSLALSAAVPDLGRGVTPLGHRPSGMGSSLLLPRRWTWGSSSQPHLCAITAARWIMEKAREFQKKRLFLLYWLCQSLCEDHNKLWKILKKMGIPDHLTCLLRNLYAGWEAVRTGHRTTGWF